MTTIIRSSVYADKVLTARTGGTSVYLENFVPGNPNQTWRIDGEDDKFSMLNVGTGQYMAYPGGNESELVLISSTGGPGGNTGYFSWGATESWGARALQCFVDSGQNVDAGALMPNPGPLTTRGWRHGRQRELTWVNQTV